MNRNSSIGASLGYIALFLGVQLGVSLVVTQIGAVYYARNYSPADAEAMLQAFSENASLWILMATSVLTVALLFAIAKKGKFSLLKESGFSGKLPLKALLSSIAAGVCANLWMSIVITLLPLPEQMMSNYAQASAELGTGFSIIGLMTIGVFAPICEEFIFRGMILKRLSAGYSVVTAILFQGLLFGVVHGDMLWIIYAGILGCVLGYVRVCTGSLKSSIAFHMAFNISSFATVLLENSSQYLILITLFVSAIIFIVNIAYISERKLHVSE